MCAFVVLDLVFVQYWGKHLPGKNVFKMTYFVLTGTQNVNSVNVLCGIPLPLVATLSKLVTERVKYAGHAYAR